jgi:hypothetical protein
MKMEDELIKKKKQEWDLKKKGRWPKKKRKMEDDLKKKEDNLKKMEDEPINQHKPNWLWHHCKFT